jgi:hypothetical protein
VAELIATIFPEISKASINDKLLFVVAQSKAHGFDVTKTFDWSLRDAENGDALDPDDGSSLSAEVLVFTPIKRQIIKVSVVYTANGDTYRGSRIISISFPGLRFSAISREDANTDTTYAPNAVPVANQEPMNLAVLNLRAAVAPCMYWRGPIRRYKKLTEGGIIDVGQKDALYPIDRTNTGDWVVKVGWEVTSADTGTFAVEDIGTVKPISEFPAGQCSNLQAGSWSSPLEGSTYLPCNGAKPNSVLSTSETGMVGRCPYYTSTKAWKYAVDDKLGFIEKTNAAIPYITAQHVQELRINSNDWTRYTVPYDEFEKRFPTDTDIWAWAGYVTDEDSDVLNLTTPVRIKLKRVHVDEDVAEIIVDEEIMVHPGTSVSGGEPDYPTLIKELTDVTKAAIDFPLGSVDNPFVIRQFGSASYHTELYGHLVGDYNQVVYAVNVDYVIKQSILRGFGAIRPFDETEDPIDNQTVFSHTDYIQFLLDYAPDLVFQTTTNEDGIFSFGMDWDSNSMTWSVNPENRIPLLYEWAPPSDGVTNIKNRVKIFIPSSKDVATGEMHTDKTYVISRFMHALVHQTNFVGDCDNSDSVFKSFSADIEVQLMTGYEGIDKLIVASPDLASNYATWKRSNLEGESPKKEAYYLIKETRDETIHKENIFPLYRNKDFFVKITDLAASKLSRFQVTSAVLGSSGGSNIPLQVIDHSVDASSTWLEASMGSTYPNGEPMPANYVHLRVDESALSGTNPVLVSSDDLTIQISFDYLIHVQNTSASQGLSPLDPTKTINLTTRSPCSITFDEGDGMSSYNEDRLPPPLHAGRYTRQYTLSGSDIVEKLRYLVFIKDDEGRLIGKKESAVLFGIAVPSCGDQEIRYAWTGAYTSIVLGPRGLRFCDWPGCNGGAWGYSCKGTPMHLPSGRRQGEFTISGNCFDHGLFLDRVWWPFNRCFAPRYELPNYFATITEYVDLGGRSPKYLGGYPYFYEGVDNTGFWDCAQGTYYRNSSPLSYSPLWSGYQAVRAGDLRGGQLSEVGFYGTKGGSSWLWGVDRERFVFYVGTEKAMNFGDVNTGYALIGGVDGISGQGFLSEHAGVDINGLATEKYINPMNVLHANTICGFTAQEELATGSYEIALPGQTKPLVIEYRQNGRFYITPSFISGGDWGWPLINWVYKNTATTYTDNRGHSVTVRRGEFPDGTQTAWVYRDKLSLPIERNFELPDDVINSVGNTNLTAIVLSYPPDVETFSGVPEVFEDLPAIPSLTDSYRLPDGEHLLQFKAPKYSRDGTLVQPNFATVCVGSPTGALGPSRSIVPNGYFISQNGTAGSAQGFIVEEPYSPAMKVADQDLIDNCLTIDTVPVFVETGKVPTSPVPSDKLLHRIVVVRQPIAYNSLPYKVDLVAGPNAANEVIGIRTAYAYNRKPDTGPDSALPSNSPTRTDANVETSLLNDAWESGPMAGFTSYNEIVVTVRLVLGAHQPSVGRFLKNTHLDSITMGFTYGVYGEVRGDVPSILVEAQPVGEHTYTTIGSKIGVPATNSVAPARTVTIDNIDFPAEKLKFTFTKPSGSPIDGTSLLLNSIAIRGRVLIEKTEIITTHDMKYAISKMRKENGVGINGSIDNFIPGLPHTKEGDLDMPSTMMYDTYTGDARRAITTSTVMKLRPTIPTPQGDYGGNWIGNPDGAYAGVFKGGRVAMGRARGDMELASNALVGLDLCSGGTPLTKESFGGGGKGPLECAQEGAYKYAANFFTEPIARYKVWTHPDEVGFFESVGIKKEFIPCPGGADVSSTVEVLVPRELFLFRGDNSQNYVEAAGSFYANGHYAYQLNGGDCWCWVGNIKAMCGEYSHSCIDRYIVHAHGGGTSMSYTNDFGAVLRRFYTMFNRALIIMSVAGTSGSNELFGMAFQSTGGVDPTKFWGHFPDPWTGASVSNPDVFEMGTGLTVWWPGGFMNVGSSVL